MRFKRLRGLPIQLLAFTILPVMILLLAIAFGSQALHERSMRALVGERDERATRAAAAALTEQLNHRAAAIRGLSLRVAASTAPEEALAEADFLLPDFEGGFAVMDVDGRLLAATPGTETFWRGAPVQSGLARITPAEAAQFLPIFNEADGTMPVMLVANRADNGLLTVGGFFPENVARQVLNAIFPSVDQGAILLVDDRINVLYQAGSLSRSHTSVAQYPGVREALRGDSGTTYLNNDEQEFVIAFSPIWPVNWALVIEEPWQAVTDPLLRATSASPLILAPAIIIAAIAVWFGVRQVVQPLQQLEHQATALAWGDFEAIEAPVGGVEEIRRLQMELGHMAQKVKAAQQGLRGYLGALTVGQEEERQRLARELHDDTIQSLIALNQRLQLAQLDSAQDEMPAKLAEMTQMTTQMITDVRRFIRDLRPIYLEDLGLAPSLNMLARDVAKDLAIPVQFETMGDERRLRPEAELAYYRIAQEGLSNIARHAQATAVFVQLCFSADETILKIKDNGRGFEIPETPAEMAPLGHYGLLGMQERAELIGAQLSITSAPGEGTHLQVSLPDSPPLMP